MHSWARWATYFSSLEGCEGEMNWESAERDFSSKVEARNSKTLRRELFARRVAHRRASQTAL